MDDKPRVHRQTEKIQYTLTIVERKYVHMYVPSTPPLTAIKLLQRDERKQW